MTKNEAKTKAINAMHTAYNAIHVDDVGNMTSWELRDAMIDAVKIAFDQRELRSRRSNSTGA